MPKTDLEKIKEAISTTASEYACNGNHDSDLICDAFLKLLGNIEYQEQFGGADLEADRAAHLKGVRG